MDFPQSPNSYPDYQRRTLPFLSGLDKPHVVVSKDVRRSLIGDSSYSYGDNFYKVLEAVYLEERMEAVLYVPQEPAHAGTITCYSFRQSPYPNDSGNLQVRFMCTIPIPKTQLLITVLHSSAGEGSDENLRDCRTQRAGIFPTRWNDLDHSEPLPTSRDFVQGKVIFSTSIV